MYSPETSTSPSMSATDRPRSSTWVIPDSRGLVIREGSFNRSFMVRPLREMTLRGVGVQVGADGHDDLVGAIRRGAAARDTLAGGRDRLDGRRLEPQRHRDRIGIVLGALIARLV